MQVGPKSIVYPCIEDEMAWMLVYVENCFQYISGNHQQAYNEAGVDQIRGELQDLIERTTDYRNNIGLK